MLTAELLPLIVPPVLRNFSDAEPRVRYYACESLFNVTKICRGAILAFLPDVFAGMCKLAADVDADVKNGAALYDRLLKEVVMEGGDGGPGDSLDVGGLFIPLLVAHMGVLNPYVRQLLVGWVTALDAVPGVDMLDHAPDLLPGLFDMLSDGNREIRQAAYGALCELLDAMLRVPLADVPARIRFAPLTATLIEAKSRGIKIISIDGDIQDMSVAISNTVISLGLPRLIGSPNDSAQASCKPRTRSLT